MSIRAKINELTSQDEIGIVEWKQAKHLTKGIYETIVYRTMDTCRTLHESVFCVIDINGFPYGYIFACIVKNDIKIVVSRFRENKIHVVREIKNPHFLK